MGAYRDQLHQEHLARRKRYFQPLEQSASQHRPAPIQTPPRRSPNVVSIATVPNAAAEHPVPRVIDAVEFSRWGVVPQVVIAIVPEAPGEFRVYPTVAMVIRVCAEHFGIPKATIISPVRTAPVVRARQVAMYVAKSLTKNSLPEIGRRFSGRDHTTVLHAVRKIEWLIKCDLELAASVEAIKASVHSFVIDAGQYYRDQAAADADRQKVRDLQLQPANEE
jgi:hypothetical protein